MCLSVPYADLALKQKRIIERDVELLFSPKAILANRSLEDVRQLDVFHPTVKVKQRTLFLSEAAIAALARLTDIISGLAEIANSVSTREVYGQHGQLSKSYNQWIEQLLQPT